MRVAMPTGNSHGWGIAGSWIARETALLPPVPGVTLHSIAGHHFLPSFPEAWDRINVGYCFFESEIVAYRFIVENGGRWDHIVAGSTWCEHHLRIAGVEHASTILQGIDHETFHPLPPRTSDGRFIVFSGGKFEYRKGQDLVIAALRIFMERHDDVWLSCAWHNHWPQSIRTMEESRHVSFSFSDLPCDRLILRTLAENGIPLERVILNPVMENSLMRKVYASSDVGLFPNRCEGGNNMVMCEYMACGRPVIASPMTGHRDVITLSTALCLTRQTPVVSHFQGEPAGVWFESSVEEMVDSLERLYVDTELRNRLGVAAAEGVRHLTWGETARRFHRIATDLAGNSTLSHALPPDPEEEAQAHFVRGGYAEAAGIYRRLLGERPLDPILHNNLGSCLDRMGNHAAALLHHEKALVLDPGYVDARFNLAGTLKRLGRGDEAVKQLETVVEMAPGFPDAWHNLALCHLDGGDLTKAIRILREGVERNPQAQRLREDLAALLLERREYGEAVQHYRILHEANPNDQGVLNGLATALMHLDRLDEARRAYLGILALDPRNAIALNNLGALERAAGNPQGALLWFDRAVAVEPQSAQIHFNRSLVRLLTGDPGGWDEYEHRFGADPPVPYRHGNLPRWEGEPLQGGAILLWCEQGYGDSIQFVRYAADVASAGGRVIVEAQDFRIAPLLARAPGVDRVVVRGERVSADCQSPLMSLPRIFGEKPATAPYLEADVERVRYWRHRLGSGDRLLAGIAWKGRPTHHDDHHRSIPTELITPLFDREGICWVSLQFDPREPVPPTVFDPTGEIPDFLESAALLSSLDLVVSIDSAVAHLAGALGIPCLLLLPYDPDWRWRLDRGTTPWYSSLRLFRQRRPGEWDPVLRAVTGDVTGRVKKILK